MSRREQIESMLADQPADTFLRYALALELEKEGEEQRSLEIHRELMTEDTPYVPAFFMAAQMLAKLERTSEAREFLQQGIQAAKTQGDMHAAGEMSQFLESLDD